MDFNLNVRLKQMQSLEHYISSSWNKVHAVLDKLKWNVKDVLKDNQLIKCSVDPTHRIHTTNADNHVAKCALRKEGYELDEYLLSEPLHDIESSIHIDDHKKIEILSSAHKAQTDFKSEKTELCALFFLAIYCKNGWNGQDPDPKTAHRLTSTFSSDERLALYNYAVARTLGPPDLPEFNILQPPRDEKKSLTYEQLLVQERDAKRRRIKYKCVHTNRKNHTEVLREVIDGQMQLYKDWLESNAETVLQPTMTSETEEKYSDSLAFKKSNSVFSQNSTHSSTSSSRNSKQVSRHYRHHRDYDHNNHRRHYRDTCESYRRHEDRKYSKSYSSSSRYGHREEKDYNGYRKR